MGSNAAVLVVRLALVATFTLTIACSSGGTGGQTGTAGTKGAAGTSGAAGAASTGTAGMGTAGADAAGTTGAAGAAGSPGAAGSTGAAGTPGAAGSTGAAGATGAAGSTGAAGATGAAGSAGAGGIGAAGTGAAGMAGAPAVDITKVAPTTGCGQDPGLTVGTPFRGMLMTMGTKAPDCAATLNGRKVCGAWSVLREFFVTLPTGYVNTKAYPLLFEGPGCGGTGANLYALPDLASTVIRVGLTPPPNSVGHGTNQNQGCFDDKEGDDSVDWPFYEGVWDELAKKLCFDKNRVFVGGTSSGAWFANELGCKYAGDPVHPIRGVLPNTGGLPDQPQFKPTCSTEGMAGFWVFGTSFTAGFSGHVYAINRALQVSGCEPAGVTISSAMSDPFPISATDATSCKRYRGCPDLFPMVVCQLPLDDHGTHDAIVTPGWATFINLFSKPPLLTP